MSYARKVKGMFVVGIKMCFRTLKYSVLLIINTIRSGPVCLTEGCDLANYKIELEETSEIALHRYLKKNRKHRNFRTSMLDFSVLPITICRERSC